MRLFTILTALVTFCGILPAAAQRAGTTAANKPQDRIALSARPDESEKERPMRMACAPLIGQVFEPNGQPLMGATVLIKGTHEVYVTDATGRFQLTETIYQGQVLTIQAAGYNLQDVALADCSLPRLVLERTAGARIKRTGKRAGQVTRLNNRNTNIK